MWRSVHHERPSAAKPQPKTGRSPAKHVLSLVEGTPRRKVRISFRRVRFAHRSVSESLAQRTQRAQSKESGLSPAKAQRRKVKRIRIPNLASLRLGGRYFRIRESSTSGIFKRHAMTNMLVLVFGLQCKERKGFRFQICAATPSVVTVSSATEGTTFRFTNIRTLRALRVLRGEPNKRIVTLIQAKAGRTNNKGRNFPPAIIGAACGRLCARIFFLPGRFRWTCLGVSVRRCL